MQRMYEVSMLTPLSEKIALRAAVEPMFIKGSRQLMTSVMAMAFVGIAQRRSTYLLRQHGSCQHWSQCIPAR